MRPLDPRAWNLFPPAVLLAAACGPPGIPADETADDVAETPGECSIDTDCPTGYYCANQVCLPDESTSTYSDYSDYSDYADTPTTYTDYTSYTDYSDDWQYYECYSDYDCQPGYVCLYNTCQIPQPPPYVELPVECPGPALAEIPLPGLAPVLDLQFADVDGDDDDEPIALTAEGIAVILDDDSVVLTPWAIPSPAPIRQLVALALDGDAAIDLVGFPEVPGPAVVMLGDGTGTFTTLGELAGAPLVDRPIGFDGNLDGIDRLFAIRLDIDRATQFSDPLLLNGNNFLLGPAGASDLDVVQLDQDLAPDLLIGAGCAANVFYGPDLIVSSVIDDPLLGAGLCEWAAAAFVDGETEQPLVVLNLGDLGYVKRWDLVNDEGFVLELPNGFGSSAVANLDGSGDFVLLTDAGDGRMIWAWAPGTPACIAPLPFAGALDYAIGDRDGDGRQDVATLAKNGSGVVRLWSVP